MTTLGFRYCVVRVAGGSELSDCKCCPFDGVLQDPLDLSPRLIYLMHDTARTKCCSRERSSTHSDSNSGLPFEYGTLRRQSRCLSRLSSTMRCYWCGIDVYRPASFELFFAATFRTVWVCMHKAACCSYICRACQICKQGT